MLTNMKSITHNGFSAAQKINKAMKGCYDYIFINNHKINRVLSFKSYVKC